MNTEEFIKVNISKKLTEHGYPKHAVDFAVTMTMKNGYRKMANSRNMFRDLCNYAGEIAADRTGKKWVNVK